MSWIAEHRTLSAALLALAVLMPACGFVALRPTGGRRSQIIFWAVALAFLLALAAALWTIAPWLAVAPLFPAVAFARLAWETASPARKKTPNDADSPDGLERLDR